MSRADGLYEAAGLVSGFLLRYPGDTIEDSLVRSALVSLKSEILRQAGFARKHDDNDEHDEEFSESDEEFSESDEEFSESDEEFSESDVEFSDSDVEDFWRGILGRSKSSWTTSPAGAEPARASRPPSPGGCRLPGPGGEGG